MILRRFRRQAARHDWFATLIDLVILIVGVFLGIQVSNWNAARLDRVEGRAYRERLIGDLRDNKSDLIDRRRYYATVRGHARAALAALARPPGTGDARFLIDAFEATQINPRKLKRFTYDELLARGGLVWLGDARLREQVANYYVGVDTVSGIFAEVTPYRELVRENMPDAAQQGVRRACPERVYFTPDGSGRAKLAERCAPLPLDATTVASSAAQLRALPGLRAGLNRQISDHDGKIMLIDPLIAHVRDLDAILRGGGD